MMKVTFSTISEWIPGETVKLKLKLTNQGDDLAPNVKGTIITEDTYFTIIDSVGTFGSLLKDSSAVNDSDYFVIKVNVNCPIQYQTQFTVTFSTQNGLYPYTITNLLTLPVAMPSAYDATGPDSYGYFAYSSDDVLWTQAPQFNWAEINGIGTEIPKPINQNDFTETVSLPFTFKYYGNDFNQVRISSDGWIAFGSGTQTAFENHSLPYADNIKDKYGCSFLG